MRTPTMMRCATLADKEAIEPRYCRERRGPASKSSRPTTPYPDAPNRVTNLASESGFSRLLDVAVRNHSLDARWRI